MGNTGGISRNGVTSFVHICGIKNTNKTVMNKQKLRADNGVSCSCGIWIYSKNAALDQSLNSSLGCYCGCANPEAVASKLVGRQTNTCKGASDLPYKHE